jgi:hypothetical protein
MRTLWMAEPRNEYTGNRSKPMINRLIIEARWTAFCYAIADLVVIGLAVGGKFVHESTGGAGWRPEICADLCDRDTRVPYNGLKCVSSSAGLFASCCDTTLQPDLDLQATYEDHCQDYCASHNISARDDAFSQTGLCARQIARLCCDIGRIAILKSSAIMVSLVFLGLWVITVLVNFHHKSKSMLTSVPPLSANESAPFNYSQASSFVVNTLHGDQQQFFISRPFLTIKELRDLVLPNFPDAVTVNEHVTFQLSEFKPHQSPWAVCDAGYLYFRNIDKITLLTYAEAHDVGVTDADVTLVDSRVLPANADNAGPALGLPGGIFLN